MTPAQGTPGNYLNLRWVQANCPELIREAENRIFIRVANGSAVCLKHMASFELTIDDNELASSYCPVKA